MEKIIEIDINNQNDLIHKYNNKKMSSEIIDYIIQEAMKIKKNEKIKIVINNKCNVEKDITKMINDGLKEEYNKSKKEHRDNNIKQIIFLLLGIIFIFLSTTIEDGVIWKEILLITGWVPIWEMIDVELFSDAEGIRKRRVINKLLQSKIIEKNIKTAEKVY